MLQPGQSESLSTQLWSTLAITVTAIHAPLTVICYIHHLTRNEERTDQLLAPIDIGDRALFSNRIRALYMDMCCVNEESERVLNESADILEQAITAGRLPRLQRLQVKILEMGSMELLEDEDEEANEIFDSLKDTCRE